jgi:hypothetical protein
MMLVNMLQTCLFLKAVLVQTSTVDTLEYISLDIKECIAAWLFLSLHLTFLEVVFGTGAGFSFCMEISVLCSKSLSVSKWLTFSTHILFC